MTDKLQIHRGIITQGIEPEDMKNPNPDYYLLNRDYIDKADLLAWIQRCQTSRLAIAGQINFIRVDEIKSALGEDK